jgi:glutamate synthase domain-containing protein 2/glutamate synthase domain-containing protein 1/glutamate synthase domain-containing protein 3
LRSRAPSNAGLYDPSYEHDACGLGFVARIDGEQKRSTIEEGLEILRNLAHRGAAGSEPETGDGAGMMIQIPDAFLREKLAEERGLELPPAGEYGVGVAFIDGEDDHEDVIERVVAEEGQSFIGSRDVPVRPEKIGNSARGVMPRIRQFFIRNAQSGEVDQEAFERKLYVIRRQIHKAIGDEAGSDYFVVSLSSRTLVYKGLLHGEQVPEFYPDLQDERMTSALALVHSRFSTNTLGSWELAHPYRYVAHNGEFNTLRGNKNWMRAREARLESDRFGDDLSKIWPVINPGGSDSAAFDNALEALHLAGRSLPHAAAMMIPEAWENDDLMQADRRAFYQYHSSLMEPWDGPAAVAYTDGSTIGATLDRNGLRPARYVVTRDGRVVMASEDGVLDIAPEDIVERSRLKPGRMLVVDTERHEILRDAEVKKELASRQPYAEWIEKGEIHLDELPEAEPNGSKKSEKSTLQQRQRAFGYTMEDTDMLLAPMASEGKEPDGSMGTDTPLAILSERPQLLFNYFQQLFAQVTNPPIDPLREEMVMSLAMSLGPEQNLFDETPEHCQRILVRQPILTDAELAKVRALSRPPFASETLHTLFDVADDGAGLERAVEDLCDRAEAAVRNGATVLILSDKGVDEERAPIPSLLATSAVHHHLVRTGLRTSTSLVVETAEAREVHHFAVLVGYGASAVNPYLAFESIAELARDGSIGAANGSPAKSIEELEENYVQAVGKGLRKIISKMGISTLFSYNGAQIFEAIGLDRNMTERHFTGTASRIGGAGFVELGREAAGRHKFAFHAIEGAPSDLDTGGEYTQRMQGQYHQWNPESIVPLQRAVGTGSYEQFKQYTQHFDSESAKLSTLRGLFDFQQSPISIEEVEPASEIVKHFSTGAMSLGSISREAHETLANAMNRIGGKSNTGEGGEDPERFADDRRSSIKQVASGRFGVTTEYLVNSDVLQIKMAQGSKPGEGGQLPGHKISDYIAKIRYSTPGVGLISPPPHHDIYSIEDLAQLIHDLKLANPRGTVSVKLVSEVGVGTVAAGVAKAKADLITIAGHDGGTGASPLSSIKHAGLPWELGVAETQQVLVQNDLRSRVILQTDGQLKTGRDAIVAALLGAEEFAFSTAPLVSVGCIMMRVCHLNTCPVGIATQDPELRKKFTGTSDNVVNYFFFLAEEMREYMAGMGFRTMDEMIGRSDVLKTREAARNWKTRGLDLDAIFYKPEVPEGRDIRKTIQQDHSVENSLDNELIEKSEQALERKTPTQFEMPVKNTHRTVGGMLAGEIARRYGNEGLPDDTLRIEFKGVAGQSFGAWGTHGLTMRLTGAANDYAGKGLSGGRIAIRPDERAGYDPDGSIVTGNVALYGATGGEAYFRGNAGERFAVRNSGAYTVVEGVGDHGCEYMTGGVVVVLGSTGRNFAAGMSGGFAFILDEDERFGEVCNMGMVGLEAVESEDDRELLWSMIESHLSWTGSEKARRVLDDWENALESFVKVMPEDLKRVLAEQQQADLERVDEEPDAELAEDLGVEGVEVSR